MDKSVVGIVNVKMGVMSHPRPVSTAPPWRACGCAGMGVGVSQIHSPVMTTPTVLTGVMRRAVDGVTSLTMCPVPASLTTVFLLTGCVMDMFTKLTGVMRA